MCSPLDVLHGFVATPQAEACGVAVCGFIRTPPAGAKSCSTPLQHFPKLNADAHG